MLGGAGTSSSMLESFEEARELESRVWKGSQEELHIIMHGSSDACARWREEGESALPHSHGNLRAHAFVPWYLFVSGWHMTSGCVVAFVFKGALGNVARLRGQPSNRCASKRC